MDCLVLAVKYGFGSQTLKVGIQFSFIYTVDQGEEEERIEVC